MLTFVIGITAFLFGMGIASYISGYVAYQEGIEDERKKWYIHAHYWCHKEYDSEG